MDTSRSSRGRKRSSYLRLDGHEQVFKGQEEEFLPAPRWTRAGLQGAGRGVLTCASMDTSRSSRGRKRSSYLRLDGHEQVFKGQEEEFLPAPRWTRAGLQGAGRGVLTCASMDTSRSSRGRKRSSYLRLDGHEQVFKGQEEEFLPAPRWTLAGLQGAGRGVLTCASMDTSRSSRGRKRSSYLRLDGHEQVFKGQEEEFLPAPRWTLAGLQGAGRGVLTCASMDTSRSSRGRKMPRSLSHVK